MAVFGYLPKLKRGQGLAFGAHFLHDFSKKIFFNTLSTDKVSMSYLFSFPRYQANCVVKFFLFFYNNDYTQSKNKLKRHTTDPDHNILYNQGKIKVLK